MIPDLTIWFFISSGIFLGWSLGANHAVNVFGTAVVSKMVKFRTAAITAGIFVVLGSVISGGGTTRTIEELGSINTIAGSFSVALSVGIAILWMTKVKLPVSTSQAVIGAIIGGNFFTGSTTDFSVLSKILLSWIVSPVIAAVFGYLIFMVMKRTVLRWKIHMLKLDGYTRTGLIVVGALASYSMGANNIANVMGMFASSAPLPAFHLTQTIVISGMQQLFFLGGLAIAIGIKTYGYNVMETVGTDLYKISPITGFVVVLAEFIVLSLFTSQALEAFLLERNLPSFPLVPLSATQAFIGAVIGVGLAKDPQSINLKVFGKISVGWVLAPLTAGILSFVLLFFMQNVFEQKVITPKAYEMSPSVVSALQNAGIDAKPLKDLTAKRFVNTKLFKSELLKRRMYSNDQLHLVMTYALIDSFRIDSVKIQMLDAVLFSDEQRDHLKKLHGKVFRHKIDFIGTMYADTADWQPTGNKLKDRAIERKKTVLEAVMRVQSK